MLIMVAIRKGIESVLGTCGSKVFRIILVLRLTFLKKISVDRMCGARIFNLRPCGWTNCVKFSWRRRRRFRRINISGHLQKFCNHSHHSQLNNSNHFISWMLWCYQSKAFNFHIQWLRWNWFHGFLEAHQFLNNGFWNPLILEQWVLEPINFGIKGLKFVFSSVETKVSI